MSSSLFWLQNPAVLFEDASIWPFDQQTPQTRGNAIARLLFFIALVTMLVVPQISRNAKGVLLMLVMVNLSLGIALYVDSPPSATTAQSLLYVPRHSGNPYGNPMLYDPVPGVHKTHAPIYNERPGNTCELSDGLLFHSIPDRTLQARQPYNHVADGAYWMNGGSNFGPFRGHHTFGGQN